MKIMLSKSVAPIIALIMCSSLAFTGGMANNVSIVRPEPQTQQLKKVDDRLIAGTSKFAFKLYEQALKQPGRKECFYFSDERHAGFGNDI